MLRFLSNLSANLVALFIFFFVIPVLGFIFMVFFAVQSVMTSVGQKNVETFKPGGALVYDLGTNIVEGTSQTKSMSAFLSNGVSLSVYDICARISSVSGGDGQNVLFIHGSFDNAYDPPSFAQISEIRAQIERFKTLGGKVFAYLEYPSLRDYYLASAADRVILNPQSTMEFKGLSATSPYFGNALKKYGVDVQVVKSGEFKNFGEMFTSDKMSAEDKVHLEGILKAIWNSIVERISISRGIPIETLNSIAQNGALFTAQDAIKMGLVDDAMFEDEILDLMANTVGSSGDTFLQNSIFSVDVQQPKHAPKVAVVYMKGNIVGRGDMNTISAEYYAPLFREIRRDKSIRAVVIRVDSGGGSAFASEVIRREIELTAQEVPVVASFGGIAASGAYWLGCAAEEIIVTPQTITGSIGVFGLAFSAEKLAGDFGITFDGVKTAPFADIGTIARPMSEQEVAKLQSLIDVVYGDFVRLVSKSRKMSIEEATALANGRIYSAGQAMTLRLADKIGGLGDAITSAAEKAGLASFAVDQYPKYDPFKELFKDFMPPGQYAFELPREVRSVKDTLAVLAQFNERSKIYARMPFDVRFE